MERISRWGKNLKYLQFCRPNQMSGGVNLYYLCKMSAVALNRLLRQMNSDDLHRRIKAIETISVVDDEVCLKELRSKMSLLHNEYQA